MLMLPSNIEYFKLMQQDQSNPTQFDMSSPAKKLTLQFMPDEIKLQILGHYFNLRNGLHSERYPFLKDMRVDRISCIEGWGNLVPECLYRNNTLVIKPLVRMLGSAGNVYDQVFIAYPPPNLTNYVQKLEFRFEVFPFRSIRLQVNWLKKLADGDLGF